MNSLLSSKFTVLGIAFWFITSIVNSQQFPVDNRPQQLWCTADILLFYQDCRMCACPRPNRPAKCSKKTCDLRTKDSGQCPPSVLRMDDSQLCPAIPHPQCKADSDCPGNQLCCFDFCHGSKCQNPIPLDAFTGYPIHSGRGYP